MSYLITSNIPDENILRANMGLQQPNSYTNNLNDTFKIPKNAQIAVESVKINKNGGMSLSRNNSTFAFYFGEDVDETVQDGWNNLLSYAVQSSPFENYTGDNFNGEVDFIATKLQEVANRLLFHPNLYKHIDTSKARGFLVEAKRNASNLDFEGFQFTLDNPDTSKNSDLSACLITSDFDVALSSAAGSFNWNSGSKLFQNTDTAGIAGANTFVLEKAPISLVDGKIVYEITQPTTQTRMGLCRDLGDNLLGTLFRPDYLFSDTEDQYGDGFRELFDYEVEIEGNASGTIRVYHLIPQVQNDGSILMVKTEFDYRYLNSNNYYNAKDDQIEKVTFTVNNERVKIQLTNASATEFVLCDGTGTVSASNVKPVNMATRFLFPKFELQGGGEIQIINYEGVEIDGFIYGDGFDFTTKEFYLRMSTLGQAGEDLLKQMETSGTKAFDFTNQVGLTSNRINYNAKLIFSPSELYPYLTHLCNSARALGFLGRSVATPTESYVLNNQLVWISDSVPKLKDTQSLFVRMKNLTINSVNLANSRHSKILYHIPSFSNTDESVGTLFFAPSEKMYLDLNNTEDLYLNSIEVDIVTSDEKLATNLNGKTTVCFHVREKK